MRCSSAYGTCDMITYSIGVDLKLWPSEGGLIGNACTPGTDAISGRSSSAMSCCLRVLSSHGLSRRTVVPSTTVGLPAMAV
jgi:hypothetical protein